MKHYCLIFSFFLFLFSVAKAAPGDTTVVQSHTVTQLANNGFYDAPAVFPVGNTTYRDIKMTFTLGKYQCPGSPQYCGDWDYTVRIYLYSPTDTFEIGKLITPYAGISRFPWNWQHRYEFDVTDYARYLKGNTNIRIQYSGYSGGFTANVKFHMIEGIPPRNVIKIDRLWRGSIAYGNSAAVEAKMNARTLTMPAAAQAAVLKFVITGHGANGSDNCSEFCSKYYRVLLNNNLIAQKNIWRDNCGSNNLYPQTGTWIYDRAGWCPGDLVYPNFHPLNGLTPGSNFTLDVDFQAYNVATSQASYGLEGQVIYYGTFNQTSDAALEAIISPNNHEAYFRANPVCEDAKIKVRNTGSTTINSLELTYGLAGGNLHTLPLSVTILPGNTEEIILPGNSEFITMGNSKAKFIARIVKVNGASDTYALNNEMQSEFLPMPVWPNNFMVTLNTNAAGSQTKWRILDAYGNEVSSRLQTSSNSVFRDTVQLPAGCYRLEVTDTGCNGLSWWAAQNQGNGSIQVRSLVNNAILNLKGNFNGDFGCGFTEAFRIQTALGTHAEKAAFNLYVYPNPGKDLFQVVLPQGKAYQLKVTDLSGKVVKRQAATAGANQLDLTGTAKGIYLLHVNGENSTVVRKLVVE